MILVTGATGFTGSHVVDLLLREGYELSVFARKTSDVSHLPSGIKTIAYGDLDNTESLVTALRSADTLVNIASLGFGHAPNIVTACVEAGVKRAIFISTTAIFTNLNAKSKTVRVAAEKLIMESGLDYTILRPTMIYGTHRDRNMCRLIRFLNRYPVIPIVGNGAFLQQPVYVQDVAMAVRLALGNRESVRKVYNVAGAKALTYNQVIDTTAQALGKRVLKLHVPLGVVTPLLGLYEKVTAKPKLKVEQLLRLNEHKAFSIEPIQKDLGYSPLAFSEGIKREVAEMREKGFI